MLYQLILFPTLTQVFVLQTSFSLYLYNMWINFYKLSYTVKPQVRAIYTYVYESDKKQLRYQTISNCKSFTG